MATSGNIESDAVLASIEEYVFILKSNFKPEELSNSERFRIGIVINDLEIISNSSNN